MTNISWKDKLNKLPITGKDICEVLAQALSTNEVLELRSIETLCSNNCEDLGNLWHSVSTLKVERISAGELSRILENADQIVSLDLRCESNLMRDLLIEDGELFEISL